MELYDPEKTLDHCSICERPFRNGEVFGVLPEDPTVTACDKCAQTRFDGEKALLLEVHLTGEPIRGEVEMREAHKTIGFFRYILTTDTDPRIEEINSTQREYLEERLHALLEALGEVEVCALPEGLWGLGNATR